jgi:hypothetical protein
VKGVLKLGWAQTKAREEGFAVAAQVREGSSALTFASMMGLVRQLMPWISRNGCSIRATVVEQLLAAWSIGAARCRCATKQWPI